MSVESAIVFMNGFLQGTDPSEGLYETYREAAALWHDRRRDLILHRTWKSSPKETANLITKHNPANICFVGYSYGCGWGLTQLAAELAKIPFGQFISDAFLIDPVTRYSLPMRWKALGWACNRRKLVYKVPPNVLDVYPYRQVNDNGFFEPVGHRAVATHKRTTIHPETVFGSRESLLKYASNVPAEHRVIDDAASHANMDSNAAIRFDVLEKLARLTPPPKAQP